MNNENMFQYTYSAPENQEVLDIRSKYLPRQETKLDELKRLDKRVQTSGITQSLWVGIISCLVFGTGLCFAMKVIGNAVWLGILLGLVGMVGMLVAYPIRKKALEKAKQKYAPQILQLTNELTDESQKPASNKCD